MARLRFRKSFKIAPGIKLNVGKRGLSMSAGVKGARVTVGSNRITTTVGVPGTGLYSTQTTTSRGFNELTPAQARKQENFERAVDAVNTEADDYNRFLSIGNKSPSLFSENDFKQALQTRDFAMSIYDTGPFYRESFLQKELANSKTGSIFWSSLGFLVLALIMPKDLEGVFTALGWITMCSIPVYAIGRRLVARNNANAAETEHESFITDLRKKHPQVEENRIANLELVYAGNEAETETAIENCLEDFAQMVADMNHSFEMEASFEFKSPNTVFLDVDLPEIENVVIDVKKKALKSGAISETAKKDKDKNQEYAVGVIGISFNLAARIFNLSPSIKNVVFAGYTDRIDPATGHQRPHYVMEITFDRVAFAKLNLQNIDPLQSIALFNGLIRLRKDFYLEEISLTKVS